MKEYNQVDKEYHDNDPGYETDFMPNEISPMVLPRPIKQKKPRRRMTRMIAGVLVAAILMLGSGAFGALLTAQHMGARMERWQADTYATICDLTQGAMPVGEVNPGGNTLTLPELFQGANPAVVAISTQIQGRNAFGMAVTQPSAGSGFLVSEDGYIVTNHHVIENAISISVLLYDGTSHPAALVGGDAHSDIAVLKIDVQDRSFLSFADSDTLLVGEPVAAIGNPLGEFANSMSVGVVSALDREINIDGTPRTMLQTDAAVNRGNSGGPLVDMTGRVVGVVTAKSGGMNVEGLGFAIPSNVVQGVTEDILENGFVRGRAVMGVQIGETVLDGKRRIFVDNVISGSGADRAGVQSGDIILSANGKTVSSFVDIRNILDTLSPGDEMSMQAMRNGSVIEFSITLDESRPPT